LVAASPYTYSALTFFIGWPRLDLAAKLVLDKRDTWDGRHYDALPGAAAALEHDYPAAATVLYRALLDNILARAKSQAYGYGARYLARLAVLGANVPDNGIVETHDSYCTRIKQKHGRKTGFWSQVEGKK